MYNNMNSPPLQLWVIKGKSHQTKYDNSYSPYDDNAVDVNASANNTMTQRFLTRQKRARGKSAREKTPMHQRRS